MHFDPTISLGVIIQVLSMVIVGTGLYYGLKGDIAIVKNANLSTQTDVSEMKADIKEIKKDLIVSLDRRIHEVELALARLERN